MNDEVVTENRYDPASDGDVVRRARASAARRARDLGHGALADDAALVLSELMTNALLHGGGCTGFDVSATNGGLRVEVRDRSRVPPMLGEPTEGSLTGRGVQLIAALAARWGAEATAEGKLVWAELTGTVRTVSERLTEQELLSMWSEVDRPRAETRFHVHVGDVPTDLLLAAKSHVDNLVREFTLASAGARAGLTADVPPPLAALLHEVVDAFSEARLAIKHQALVASRAGEERTSVTLELPAHAADAAERYVAALDEVDAYCRARRLLTLETPPQHRVFRHWYVSQVAAQLRAAAKGLPPPPAQPFESRLLAELDRLAAAQRMSERAAKLYAVASALATAATPEAVADAVLHEGVVALGASGGGMLLASTTSTLQLPGVVGYDETTIARLRNERRDAELPAAVALRTGEAVWLESREERDARFPDLTGFEADTIALCAVPLQLQGRTLGALRFSFNAARLFDQDERRFVLALAAQAAQALERAQLQQARVDVSHRLQRSLLPPRLPAIPHLDVAAMYHPYGDGMDVGGDFYDIWQIGAATWCIAVGDAAGTGPEAATMTALVRHSLRAIAMSETDPIRVMSALNRALIDAAIDERDERFCTVVFGVLTADGSDTHVSLTSGGHPSPMIRRASGYTELVYLDGTLLGIFDNAHFTSTTVSLHPGDTLILVTDGVIEARRDGAIFDTDGVEAVLSRPAESAKATVLALEAAVLAHTGGVLGDDMAALVLRVDGGSENPG